MTCSSCREDSAAFACLQETTACMRLFLFLCFPAASAVDVIPSLEIRMDSANQHSPTPACVRIAGQQASTIITTTAHRVAARFSNGLGGALLERVVLLVRVRHLPRHGCLGLVGGCVRPLSVLGECSTTKGSLPGIPGITVYRAGFLSPAIARGKIGGI